MTTGHRLPGVDQLVAELAYELTWECWALLTLSPTGMERAHLVAAAFVPAG